MLTLEELQELVTTETENEIKSLEFLLNSNSRCSDKKFKRQKLTKLNRVIELIGKLNAENRRLKASILMNNDHYFNVDTNNKKYEQALKEIIEKQRFFEYDRVDAYWELKKCVDIAKQALKSEVNNE